MPIRLRPATQRAAAVLAALVLVASTAAAQFAAPRPAPRPSTQTASVNLIGLPFGVVSGEYERAIGTDGLAFGLGGTASFDDANANNVFDDASYGVEDRFSSLQAKLKYYPAARGLRGFAIGMTAGFASVRGTTGQLIGLDSTRGPGGAYFISGTRYSRVRASLTRPTVGTVVDYNFLIGRRQRFLIGLGVGARRVIGDRQAARQPALDPRFGSGSTFGLDRTLFDGRLQVGLGF